jgi:hypothetical protein
VRVNSDGTLDARSSVPTESPSKFVTPSFLSLGAGLTGTWFDPAQGDQGFMLEVLPGTPMLLLATWFTFAPREARRGSSASGHQGRRRHDAGIQAAGAGARFPPNLDATNVHTVSWGTAHVSLHGLQSRPRRWSSLARATAAVRWNLRV